MCVVPAMFACSGTSIPDGSMQPDLGVSSDATTDTGLRPDVASSDASIDAPAMDAGATDVAADNSADVTMDVACTGAAVNCAAATDSGICGDVIVPGDCVRGVWTCPAGTMPLSSCRCAGRPPGRDCICGPGGWQCGDAATVDSAVVAVDCNPQHVTCRSLPPVCTGDAVPSVVGTCWGACVPFNDCAPIPCEPGGPERQCPNGYTCYTARRTCGPLV